MGWWNMSDPFLSRSPKRQHWGLGAIQVSLRGSTPLSRLETSAWPCFVVLSHSHGQSRKSHRVSLQFHKSSEWLWFVSWLWAPLEHHVLPELYDIGQCWGYVYYRSRPIWCQQWSYAIWWEWLFTPQRRHAGFSKHTPALDAGYGRYEHVNSCFGGVILYRKFRVTRSSPKRQCLFQPRKGHWEKYMGDSFSHQFSLESISRVFVALWLVVLATWLLYPCCLITSIS